MKRGTITKEQMTPHSIDDEFVFRKKMGKKQQQNNIQPVPMKRKSKSWPTDTTSALDHIESTLPPGAGWLKAMRRNGYTNITSNSKKYKQLLKNTVYNRHTAEACEEMFDLDYGFGLVDHVTEVAFISSKLERNRDQDHPRSAE
jgi:hypothetical protein